MMDYRAARIINYLFFISNFFISLGFLSKNQAPELANPAATSLFFGGIILLERFTSFKLKNYIRILLSLTLISHSLIGEYYRAYYNTVYFDDVLHCFGAFSFALFAYDLFNSHIKVQASHPAAFIFILVFLLGISLGTFFELVEFLLDLLLKEKNQFSLVDTDLDLFFDSIGSMLAGIFQAKKHLLLSKLKWTGN